MLRSEIGPECGRETMTERNERHIAIDRARIEAAMREARRLRAEHIARGIQGFLRLLRRRITGLGRRTRTAAGAHA